MSVKKHKTQIKKMKKQLRVLQKKEAQGRNKLRAALKKISKLSRSYKTKLAKNVRSMKDKMSSDQAASYAKAAINIERQLMKGIASKVKSLTNAAGKIEKKFMVKLTKSLTKKAQKRKSKVSSRKKNKK